MIDHEKRTLQFSEYQNLIITVNITLTIDKNEINAAKIEKKAILVWRLWKIKSIFHKH
jgi:hypothetical protein